MTTYKIVRFRFKGRKKTTQTGLTLAEAKAHCNSRKSVKKTKNGTVIWFEGFTKE